MSTTASNIARAIVSGIRNSQETYKDTSGGVWIWEGAEFWVTVCTAKELKKIGQNYYVTVESNIEKIMSASGRAIGRPYDVIRGRKRFDIVLWKRDCPIAPIEIKCQQSDINLLMRDLNRVSAAIRQSNMEIGALGYYFSANSRSPKSRKNAKQKIKDYISNVEEVARASFDSDFKVHPPSFIGGNTEDAWAAGCLLIEQR